MAAADLAILFSFLLHLTTTSTLECYRCRFMNEWYDSIKQTAWCQRCACHENAADGKCACMTTTLGQVTVKDCVKLNSHASKSPAADETDVIRGSAAAELCRDAILDFTIVWNFRRPLRPSQNHSMFWEMKCYQEKCAEFSKVALCRNSLCNSPRQDAAEAPAAFSSSSSSSTSSLSWPRTSERTFIKKCLERSEESLRKLGPPAATRHTSASAAVARQPSRRVRRLLSSVIFVSLFLPHLLLMTGTESISSTDL